MTKNFHNPTPVGAAQPPVRPVHQPTLAQYNQASHEYAISVASESEVAPSAHDIAQRAYELYVEQGSRPGHDIEHWLEAEKQLREEYHRLQNHGVARRAKN
jgi:hypothetical protein